MVSDNLLWFFKGMFYLNLIQVVAVFLTMFGTKWFACKCFGGLISMLTTTTTLVLTVFGFIWRFKFEGRVCSGDFLTKEPSYKGITEYRYWIKSGMAMKFILMVQVCSITCQCCVQIAFSFSEAIEQIIK